LIPLPRLPSDRYNLQLVAQPIGINDYEEGGLEKYSRVMLETQIKSPGEFLKLNFNISEVTSADKAEIDTDLKKVQQKALIKIGHKLITWYPVKVEKINGMSCIHLNFIRQFNENPNVLVNMYMFFNNDRVHTLTLSYRIKEKVYWESDFKAILKSFRITNIK
jgi:hypothetical protein